MLVFSNGPMSAACRRKRGDKKTIKRNRGHEEEKEGATSSNGNR